MIRVARRLRGIPVGREKEGEERRRREEGGGGGRGHVQVNIINDLAWT
jgi:hypothetical protein